MLIEDIFIIGYNYMGSHVMYFCEGVRRQEARDAIRLVESATAIL